MSHAILRCVGGPLDGREIGMTPEETHHTMLDVSRTDELPEDATAADLPALGWYIRDGDVARWRPREPPLHG